jgi:hypothetical protein
VDRDNFTFFTLWLVIDTTYWLLTTKSRLNVKRRYLMHRIPALRSVVRMMIKSLFLNLTPEWSKNNWSWPPRNPQRLLIYQLNYQTACLYLRKANKIFCRMKTSIKLRQTSILIIFQHWMLFYCTISANEGFSLLSMF